MNITPYPPAPGTADVVGMTVIIARSRDDLGELRIALTGQLDIRGGAGLADALVGLSPPVHAPGQRDAAARELRQGEGASR